MSKLLRSKPLLNARGELKSLEDFMKKIGFESLPSDKKKRWLK